MPVRGILSFPPGASGVVLLARRRVRVVLAASVRVVLSFPPWLSFAGVRACRLRASRRTCSSACLVLVPRSGCQCSLLSPGASGVVLLARRRVRVVLAAFVRVVLSLPPGRPLPASVSSYVLICRAVVLFLFLFLSCLEECLVVRAHFRVLLSPGVYLVGVGTT